MRKKLKEIMNKEEGFTLVELLAVIVILGIIMAIAIPAIGNVINKSQEQADKAEIELIEDAAKLYFISEKGAAVTSADDEDVSVKTLIDEGYLDINPDRVEKIDITKTVAITVDSKGNASYKYTP